MQDNTQATIGSRITVAREKAGLTQQELADLVRLSRNTIKNYENGNSSPTCVNLEGIAKSLSVEPAFLFSGLSVDAQQKEETQSGDDLDLELDDTAELEEEVNRPADATVETAGVDKLSDHLQQLSELELDGDRLTKKKAEAHIKLIHVAADGLTLEGAVEQAEKHDLVNADQIASPLNELSSVGFDPNENEVAELTDQIITEVIERLIDHALVGSDLYAVDFKVLDDFSESHDIYPNRLIAFGWRGYEELVPAIREKVREIMLSGELPWEME